jgi:hypothetical protein
VLDHLIDMALVFGEAFECALEFFSAQRFPSTSTTTESREQIGWHFVDRNAAGTTAPGFARVSRPAFAARAANLADLTRRPRRLIGARKRSRASSQLLGRAGSRFAAASGEIPGGPGLFATLGLALRAGLLLRAGLARLGSSLLFATLCLAFRAGLLLRAGLARLGSGLLFATLCLALRTGLLLRVGFARLGSGLLFATLCLALRAGLLLRTRLAGVGSRLVGSFRRISGFVRAFRRFSGRGLRLLGGLAATGFALRRLTGFSLGGFRGLARGLRSRLRLRSLL